jgi:arylformamidase
MFGREEVDHIAPAIEAARAKGIDAQGPFPADTVFLKSRDGAYDMTVALYHDQGLMAVKLVGFGRVVTLLIGLPLIPDVDGPRDSVRHRGEKHCGSRQPARSSCGLESARGKAGSGEKAFARLTGGRPRERPAPIGAPRRRRSHGGREGLPRRKPHPREKGGVKPSRVIDISVPNGPGQHFIRAIRAEGRVRPSDRERRRLQRLAAEHGQSHGTHVDAPYHFLKDGPKLGEVPLDRMVGQCVVADLRGRRAVDAASLRDVQFDRGDILLCLTDNSAKWAAPSFQKDFTFVTKDAADVLVDRGVRALGMDYLSIEEFGSPDFPVHHRLLGAGVFVIEGLDLGKVAPGRYYLVCLPLKYPNLDGAPARAVLLEG